MLALCALFFSVLGMTADCVAADSKLYIFGQITGGDLGLCPDAFKMVVTDVPGGDQALFTFTNNCDSDGVLGRIFFMENDLMDFVEILPPENDFWSLKEGNAMLPGGHPLGFTPQNSFGVYADPARPKTGLHYDEFVTLLFDLTDGVTFSDVIAEIDDQSLGVGLHAQSLPGGSSASFSTIPEPLTLSLLGIGTLLIRNKRRGTAQ
jgi:hypothetical protein